MLRASIEYSGADADLSGIAEGAEVGDAGIEHGALLTAFADAAVMGEPEALESARDALRTAASSAVVVDAAGVIGNFERMVRIADSTGIPLDTPVAAMTVDIRNDLGIDEFGSARNTPSLGLVGRMFGRVGRVVGLAGIRALTAFGRKNDGKSAAR
jgi:hypothetical protein